MNTTSTPLNPSARACPNPLHTGMLRSALALACLVLAACAGPAVRQTPSPPAAAKPKTVVAAPAAPTSGATRPGGYYLDDGPSDFEPDLATIPDAEPRAEELNPRANRPYVALGQEYVPEQELKAGVERGRASWYGRRFHGKKTSSGEPYDMHKMTAAHPTLPIPSYARVTNVANGRSVVVRVNDRGPFVPGRTMDLSYAAARKLDYVGVGHTDVEIETIVPDGMNDKVAAAPPERAGRTRQPAAPAPVAVRREASDEVVPVVEAATTGATATKVALRSAPAAVAPAAGPPVAKAGDAGPPDGVMTALNREAAGKEVFVQVGAFSNNDRAEGLRARLALDFSWLSGALKILHAADGMFRLHAGPYRSMDEAFRVADRLRAAVEFKPIIVLR